MEQHPTAPNQPRNVYPDRQSDIIYADVISNIANTDYVVKINYVRIDTAADIAQTPAGSIVAQVIMPIDGFINSCLFMQQYLDHLKEQGVITEKDIDQVKNRKV